MKRILLISDNANLTSFFIDLVAKQELERIASFDYRYSIINKKPASMIALGCKAIDVKEFTSVDWIIKNFDLVISIHCKQIFPLNLVSAVKCVNVHPGLNPHNRGWYPQVFSIINKKPFGATIHQMNRDVDAGPIFVQKTVNINSYDTSLSAYEKVQEAEFELLRDNIKLIILDEIKDLKYPILGNYNSIKDFREICCLDINKIGSLKSHLDLLRALTHGTFDNAYYIDDNGKKVFVKIILTPELHADQQ